MIICHCAAISDRDVKAHVARGARTIDELVDDCPVAQNCGSCRPTVEHLLSLHADPRTALAG